MDIYNVEKQPEGTRDTQCAAVTLSRDEITLEDITTDVENIQTECKKINCNPIMNVISGIYKLFCDLFRCFKSKEE